MNLTVNGEAFVLKGAQDIPSLLVQLGAHSERVAIMLNDAVVSREKWNMVTLAECDRVEVLTFAGGG